jgi:hypothetical protein
MFTTLVLKKWRRTNAVNSLFVHTIRDKVTPPWQQATQAYSSGTFPPQQLKQRSLTLFHQQQLVIQPQAFLLYLLAVTLLLHLHSSLHQTPIKKKLLLVHL